MQPVEQTGPDDPYGLRAAIDEWREDTGNGKRPSNDNLAFKARDYGAPDGFVGSWLSKVFAGTRPYDADLLAALALALEHRPEELPHFRLALMRRLLDERLNGLDGAMEVLGVAETALRERLIRGVDDLIKLRNQAMHYPGLEVVAGDHGADVIATERNDEGDEQIVFIAQAKRREQGLSEPELVDVLKKVFAAAGEDVDLSAVLVEATTPSRPEAVERFRALLQQAAQQQRERSEEPPEEPATPDAHETRP